MDAASVANLPEPMRSRMYDIHSTYNHLLDYALDDNGTSQEKLFTILKDVAVDLFNKAQAAASETHANLPTYKQRQECAMMFARSAIESLVRDALDAAEKEV
jgi:hypothetical protein